MLPFTSLLIQNREHIRHNESKRLTLSMQPTSLLSSAAQGDLLQAHKQPLLDESMSAMEESIMTRISRSDSEESF